MTSAFKTGYPLASDTASPSAAATVVPNVCGFRKAIGRLAALGLSIVLGAASLQAHAVIVVNGLNMFHDLRGDNNVGIGSGDRLQYGGNVVGGSLNTSLSAFYAPQNLTDTATPCSPLTVNPNFCSNSVNFANQNPASVYFNVPRTAEPWTFTFTRAGETPLVVSGPSLTGANFYVPHPTNVAISGSGTTPTISWTLPAGYTPDGLRVQIFDRSTILFNGTADIIFTTAVSPTATSFTLPSGVVSMGGNYAINFQVVETRGDVTFTNSNAQILTRSSSFFNFTPLDSSAPPNVYLPQVSGGAFHFNIDNVGPTSITFIDPIVAIGYDYQIGAGDPNFASVLLPTGIGDDQYDLFLFDLGLGDYVDSGIDLTGDAQFFFGAGGVDRFRILGIETSAGLDPDNVTAFITGLTFVADGQFTGTMTPLTAQVQVFEPGSLALLGLGLLGLGWSRRKKA